MENLNKYIDHTLLKPDATKVQIEKLAEEAIQYDFMSVCINPTWVKYAHQLLKDTNVKVCTVIGFPLGANTSEVKAFETNLAILEGADEVDMVINIGAVKDQNWELVQSDIEAVVEVSNGRALVKVIIETCLLTKDEIEKVSQIVKMSGADFIKTSTGFSTGGAKVENIALMRQMVGPDIGVKASGGISNFEDAQTMIDAGATRIGASKGIAIVSANN